MGQKVNPHGLRVGVIKDWDSRWYARNDKVGDLIVEDYKVRRFLKNTLKDAGVPKIEIERDSNKVRIYIHCSRPGLVIGKGARRSRSCRPRWPAHRQARGPLHRRGPHAGHQRPARGREHRRPAGAPHRLPPRDEERHRPRHAHGRQGIKVMCGGRLGGAEIARSECYHEGTIPLQTLGPTSTTASPRPPPPTAASASRSGSTRARSSARPCAPPRAPWTSPSRRSAAATPPRRPPRRLQGRPGRL